MTLPALSAAKVALYRAMREAKVGKAELARRRGLNSAQIDRLLSLAHSSKIERVETALRSLGKQIAIEIRDAA